MILRSLGQPPGVMGIELEDKLCALGRLRW